MAKKSRSKKSKSIKSAISKVAKAVRKVEATATKQIKDKASQAVSKAKDVTKKAVKVAVEVHKTALSAAAANMNKGGTKVSKAAVLNVIKTNNAKLAKTRELSKAKQDAAVEKASTIVKDVLADPKKALNAALSRKANKLKADLENVKTTARDAKEALNIPDEKEREARMAETQAKHEAALDRVEQDLKDTAKDIVDYAEELKDVIEKGGVPLATHKIVTDSIERAAAELGLDDEARKILDATADWTGIQAVSRVIYNYDIIEEKEISPQEVGKLEIVEAMLTLLPLGVVGGAAEKIGAKAASKVSLKYVDDLLKAAKASAPKTGWIDFEQKVWNGALKSSIGRGLSSLEFTFMKTLARTDPEVLLKFATKHPKSWEQLTAVERKVILEEMAKHPQGKALISSFTRGNLATGLTLGKKLTLFGLATGAVGFVTMPVIYTAFEARGDFTALEEAGVIDKNTEDILKLVTEEATNLGFEYTQANKTPSVDLLNLLNRKFVDIDKRYRSVVKTIKDKPVPASTWEKFKDALRTRFSIETNATTAEFKAEVELKYKTWKKSIETAIIILSRLLQDEKAGAEPTSALVTFSGIPLGARVKVSGQEFPINLGEDILLPLGQYTAIISENNYVTKQATFSVPSTEPQTITINLSPIPEKTYSAETIADVPQEILVKESMSPVTIQTDPEVSARVTINGVYQYSTTPLTVYLPISEYTVHLEAKGYFNFDGTMPSEAFADGEFIVEMTALPTEEVAEGVPTPSFVTLPPSFGEIGVAVPLVSFAQPSVTQFTAPQTQRFVSPRAQPAITRRAILDIETTGINPWDSQLMSIGVKDLSQPDSLPIIFMEANEEATLHTFLQWVKLNEIDEFVGYNVSFDYRYIFTKAMFYGLGAKEFFTAELRDVQNMMKQIKEKFVPGQNKSGTLEDWSKFLFDLPNLGTHEELFQAWAEGRTQFVAAFNERHIIMTENLLNLFEYVAMTQHEHEGFIARNELLASVEEAEPKASSSHTSSHSQLGSGFVSCPECIQILEVQDGQTEVDCPVCGTHSEIS